MTDSKIVLQAMEALGITPGMKTDPLVVREILREMKMDDFQTQYAPMKKFIKRSTTSTVDLDPVILCIRNAIIKKHPAIVEFADLALQKKWLKPSARIITALHTGYVLEAFTAAMCNNHKFLLEVHHHITKKGKEVGIDSHHFFKTFIRGVLESHSIFETIKALSVDPAIIYFRSEKGLGNRRFSQKEIRRMYKQHKLDYIEKKLLMPTRKGSADQFRNLVRVNIYEAGITDHLHCHKSNAECAEALCKDATTMLYPEMMRTRSVLPDQHNLPFYGSITHSKNHFPIIAYSPEWVSLYVTWNAAFVLGNVDDLDVTLTKLFIPSIIDCHATNFIGVRVISLWLTIWHEFFRCHEGINRRFTATKERMEMANVWGVINKKYAMKLLKKDVKESVKELDRESERFYAHPFFNLFKTASFLWR